MLRPVMRFSSLSVSGTSLRSISSKERDASERAALALLQKAQPGVVSTAMEGLACVSAYNDSVLWPVRPEARGGVALSGCIRSYGRDLVLSAAFLERIGVLGNVRLITVVDMMIIWRSL